LRQMQRMAHADRPAGDAELLALFVAHQDDEAFAVLVRRHGPLVRGVCSRWLADDADIDDAFQATFLVLARRAAAIGRPERLPGWLYGVALRTARNLRRPARAAVSRAARRTSS
ncbi:MAG: RNA polymerase sigma factor, partial [Gemmataceae bacterium]